MPRSSRRTVPAFCNRCGTSLADEAEEVAEIVAGRLVVASRPRPTCRNCATTQTELAPPQRCSTCGDEYDAGGIDWQSDEHSVAYNCTCPQGHTVAGTTHARGVSRAVAVPGGALEVTRRRVRVRRRCCCTAARGSATSSSRSRCSWPTT